MPMVAGSVPMPEGMSELHQEVWERYEAHARAAGTLTPATAGAFRDLCEAVVVRDGLLTAIHLAGYTDKDGAKQPLLSEWRQLCQQVRTAMKEFRLAPVGKAMAEAVPPPEDPFAEFDRQVQ
jgi:hypothetical protein